MHALIQSSDSTEIPREQLAATETPIRFGGLLYAINGMYDAHMSGIVYAF